VGLQLLIEQCDLQWTVGRIVFGTLVLVGVGALLGNWWIAPGLLLVGRGSGAGHDSVRFLAAKTSAAAAALSRIASEAIDLMSRGAARRPSPADDHRDDAEESDEPLRSSFRRAADEQSFGLPFREAMVNLSRRIPVPDLQS